MSENYELLRKAAKDLELFRTDLVTAGSTDGPRRRAGQNNRRTPGDLVREEILRLIQCVFLTGMQSAPRTIVFSAMEHGNGCSYVCARAAEALAAQGEGPVCLVDANLHSPMLHKYFGVSGGTSLADALLHEGPVHNFAQPIRGSNLWLLSGTAPSSVAADVMNRDRLKPRLAELRAEFSYVLVDAPPVNQSADTLALGRAADGLVLVLEAHSTRREAARRVKEVLEASNVRLLGAVLNKRTFPIPNALYNWF